VFFSLNLFFGYVNRDARVSYSPRTRLIISSATTAGTYSMQFHSYQQVPAVVAEEIIKRVRGE